MKQGRFTLKALAITFGAAFLFAGANAQTKPSATKDVTVNLILSDIIEIKIENNIVDIPFTTPAHYQTGTFKTMTDQIEVTSNNKFDIDVKSKGSDFTKTDDNTLKIPVGNLQVEMVSPAGNGTASVVGNISTSNQKLQAGEDAAIQRKYTVKYTANGTNANPNDFRVKAGTYTQDLTYTVTQL